MNKPRLPLALIVTIAIPLATVLACAATIAITVSNAEPYLPKQYNVEGVSLEKDFTALAAGRALGLHGELIAHGRTIELRLDSAPSELEDVQALILNVTHATRPEQDQQIELTRLASHSDRVVYQGSARAFSSGNWKLELSDPDRRWLWRRDLSSDLRVVAIGADGSADPSS